MHGVCDDAS
jgi:hypothetical protein